MFSESDSECTSETESLQKLTINEHYAKAFQYKKEREELQKLKDKYGSDSEDDGEDPGTDSESDESEDEDGEELTPNVDAAILRTLALIKRKDPVIYDSSKHIFDIGEAKSSLVTKQVRPDKDKKLKPVTIRQAALESAIFSQPSSPSPPPLPHVEEQQALRDETVAVFRQATAQDNEDDFLVLREKTMDEEELEEEEYRAFLEREVGHDLLALVVGNEVHDLQAIAQADDEGSVEVGLRRKQKRKNGEMPSAAEIKKKSKEEEDQEFLTNYIFNRGWIDRSAKRIPTYQEVTCENPRDKDVDALGEVLPTADPDIDEEDFEEIVDRFETSYNFRFEEPDSAAIKTYPRQMTSTVRREDKKRKEVRERKKKRKEDQLHQKKEEMKRLKNLKMKAIKSKLERIGREGGKNPEDEALQALDLEGDWDPEAHDRQMADIYGNEHFAAEGKPYWNDDIDIGDIEAAQNSKTKKKKKKKNVEEGEVLGVDVDAMDADVERPVDDEEWDGTEEMRKRKLNEYLDEIYGLDFNDMIGDMTTRFRYVPVPAQDYNLTSAEILMATDKELNEYISIKKYAPYRKDTKWDSKRNERLKTLKQNLEQRVTHDDEITSGQVTKGIEPGKKKRKGKKERTRLKGAASGGDRVMNVNEPDASDPTSQPLKRKLDATERNEDSNASARSNRKKRRRRHKNQAED